MYRRGAWIDPLVGNGTYVGARSAHNPQHATNLLARLGSTNSICVPYFLSLARVWYGYISGYSSPENCSPEVGGRYLDCLPGFLGFLLDQRLDSSAFLFVAALDGGGSSRNTLLCIQYTIFLFSCVHVTCEPGDLCLGNRSPSSHSTFYQPSRALRFALYLLLRMCTTRSPPPQPQQTLRIPGTPSNHPRYAS